MDWFAVASLGTYPTPTPTSAERAYYAASWGLLGLLGAPPAVEGRRRRRKRTWFVIYEAMRRFTWL